MMIREPLKPVFCPTPGETIDLNDLGHYIVYDVRKYQTLEWQALVAGSTWSTAVVSVYRSATGRTVVGAALATFGPGNAYASDVDVASVSYLIFKVTTAEGSALSADMTVNGFYNSNGA